MKKYAIVFGTRPEYLKLVALINEFKLRQIPHKVIYVTQHENIDETMDSHFIKIFINNIANSNNRLNNIGCEILMSLQSHISDCSDVIIQGDTATAYYSALSTFNLQKNIIHIEAGLRTYDLTRPFPEEGYRQMISRMANIHFAPHADSCDILCSEKVAGSIHNVGNTILDLINSYNLKPSMSGFVLMTFHRRENWDKIEMFVEGLKKLIEKTASQNIKYIWYLHPNPQLQNAVKELIRDVSNIELRSPCNHIEFTQQIAHCNFIISDSGGIQEEASFLGKHCVVLRSSTERNHIPKDYITVLEDYSKLDEIYENVPTSVLIPCHVYGHGKSAQKIVDILTT